MTRFPNVLVIDDDPLVGEALAEGIGDRGGACRSFTDPARMSDEDWRWADVAVIDLQLGDGRDGPGFLRDRWARGPQPRLVLVSGVDAMVLDASARAAGDIGYNVMGSIAKPIPMAQLARLLESPPAAPAVGRPPAPIDHAALVEAFDQGEINIVYQPQYDLASGELAGLEALARWISPARGPIGADTFVLAAEEQALIGRLTEIVAEAVACDLTRWSARGFAPAVSVNLSGAVLADSLLVERLRRSLGKWREHVTFELTETAAIPLEGAALEALARLRLAGFGLSLDDFGAGQNRFDRLIGAPITELKLDRRFASGLETEAGVRTVRAIAAFARAFGVRCVAEGVETKAQRDAFRDAGCDIGQGWLLGRPMGPLAVDRLLSRCDCYA